MKNCVLFLCFLLFASRGIVFAQTFGNTSIGLTSYSPTFGNNTTATSTDNSGSYLVADVYTTNQPIIATNIVTYGTSSGSVKVAIYSDNAGVPGTLLFTEVSATTTANAWTTIPIPSTYLQAGTYWIAFNQDASSTTNPDYITKELGLGSSVLRVFQLWTFSTPFTSNPGGWTYAAAGTEDFTYVTGTTPILGYAKATMATLPNNGAITSMSYYSNTSGSFELAIYNNSGSLPNSLLWSSNSITATASAWNSVNISAGTPTSLQLNAGTYWLVLQSNDNAGPSYTTGSSGSGNFIAQSYSVFPSPWSSGTSDNETWSIYASYNRIYEWTHGTSTDWQTPANWTPTRTSPATTDILKFDLGGTEPVINVPAQTISQLLISNNTTVNLTPAAAGNTLTVNDVFSTTANDVFNFGTEILSGTLTSLTNNGKIQTGVLTSTSSTPIPAGLSWGGTVEYNGTGAQTAVSGTYTNLTISNTSAAVTLGNNINMSGTLTVNAGAKLALSTYALGAATSPAAVNLYCGATTGSSITGTGTLSLGGNVTVASAGTGTNGATISAPVRLATTLTFTVASATAPDLTISGITSGITYGLTKAGSGTLSFGSNPVTLNRLTISAGTLASTSGNLTLYSNFSNSSIFANNGGTVIFNGSSSQTIGGSSATTFNNLTINNSAGVSFSAVSVNETVAGILTLTSGNITTGTNTLIVSNNSTSAVSYTSGQVVGYLQRAIANTTTPSYQFDIGDATNYTPVTVLFAGTTSGSGSLTVSTIAAMPPVASGLSQTQYINRKWTITNSGVTGFSSCSPTFTFVAGDEIGSPNTSNLVIREWNGSTWATTTNGSQLSLSTQCTGITSFGDFYDGIDNCSAIAMWFGGTNTDWNTGSNWCGGVVPTSGTNVEIPSSPPNQPNIGISASGSCQNITIDAGASLTMSSTSNLNVYGNWSNNGTFTTGTGTVTFTGTSAQSIGGNTNPAFNNLTIANTSNTVSLGKNVNMSGILTVNAGATLALSTYTLGATTAPSGVTLYCGATTGSTITGSGALTLGGDITVTNAGTGANGATISAPVALGATRTFSVADNGTPAIDFTVSGVISGSTYGVTKTGAGTLILNQANSFSGTLTVSSGAVVGTSNAGALGAGTVTLSGGILYLTNASGTALSFNRNVTVTSGSQITTDVTSTGAGNTYTLGTLSIGNQTLTIAGGSNVNGGTAGVTFGNVTHNAAPTYTVSNPSVGGVTQLSLGAVSNSTYLTTFNGNGNVIQTGVFGSGSGGITYSGTGMLTLNRANTYSGGTTLNSGTLNINNATALGTAAGTFTIGGTAIIDNTSGGTITLSNNNPLALNGDFTFTGSNVLNLGTGLTTMNGNRIITTTASTLTIGSTISQGTYNLTLTGSGTLSFGSNAITLNGLTISAGTLISTSGILTLKGNFSNNSTFTNNSGTVTFNGSSSQTIGGSLATKFNNLTINNSAGVSFSAVSVNETVAGILTLTSGNITTGTNILIVSNTSTTAVSHTSGQVVGFLQRAIANTPAPSYQFDIGDASNYTPVIVLFVGTTTGSGSLTASTVAAMPPVGSGLSQTQYINRKWTITNSGVAGFTSCSPTFTFVAGDEIGSPNTANLVIRKWNGSSWAVTTNGTRNPLSTQCTGITSFGDFYDGIDNCSTIAMWFGGTSTDWNTGSNWCSGVVPTSVTNVEIPSDPANQPNIGTAGGSCNNITIDAGASLTMGGAYNLNIYGNLSNNGAFTASTSTVLYRGTSAQSIGGNTSTSFSNLTISNTSNTVSLGQNENMSGTLTVNAGATLALSTYTLGATTAPTGVTLYCGATTGSAITGTGTLTLGGNVTVTSAGTGTNGATISTPVALGATRTFTVASATAPDLTISGIISGSTFGVIKAGAGALTLNHANSFSGGTTLNSGTLNINNATAIGSGTFTIGGAATIDNASGGTITLSNNNPLVLNSDFTFTGSNALNLGTGLTTMNGNRNITTSSGTLTIGGTISQGTYNLTKAGSGTLSFGSNPVTLNGLTISAGTLASTSGTLTLNGNFSNNGTFTNNSGTVTFNGSSIQTIGGSSATTFNNLTINNSAGVSFSAVSVNETVAGILTLTSGNITTGTNTLIVSNNSTSAVSYTSGQVVGYLQRAIANTTAPSYQFDVGDATNYTPVTVLFAGTTSGSGSLTVSTIAAMPPVASGLSQTQYINRKWTITNSGVTGFSSCSPTFTFVAGDEIGSPNTSNLVIREWNGSTWATTTNGSQLSLSTQCTGITSFGDFYDGIDNCSTIAMWFGGTSTDWNTGSNWCGGVVPTSGTNVEIPSSPPNQPNIGISASGSCQNITIDAGASLTMSSTSNLNVYGNWSNNGTFTTGTGTVTFTGTSAQSIGGNTNPAFNNLTIANTSNTVSLGKNVNMSGILTVNAGATLALSTYTLGATTAPSGVTLYCGATTGSTITGSGALTLGGDITVTNAGTGANGATISAPVALGATRTFSVADNGTPAIDFTVSGVISGSTYGVTKTGAGTLILNQANSFSGTLTVSSGAVVGTSNAGALGAGTVTLSGGILYLTNASGTALSFNRNVTVTSGSQITTDVTSTGAGNTYTLGTLSIGNQTLTIAGGSNVNGGTAGVTFGNVTHNAAPTYTVSNPSVGGVTQLSLGAVSNSTYLTTFNGNGNVIQTGVFGSGSGGITYSGTGMLTLNRANTYSGGTTLNSGTLNINNATALGTAAGTFTIGGTATIDNTSGGTITLSNNNPLALNGDFTFTGSNALNLGTGLTTMNGNRIITTTASTLTIGGTISQGTYNLTLTGSGTLSFGSNAITLNGLTISAGTLISTSGILTLKGNFSNNSTFTNNSGTVTFNGSSSQTIGGSLATKFNNLTINNSAGVSFSAVSVNETVAGILTLTSGNITTGTNILIVSNTSTTAVSHTSGQVVGFLQRAIANTPAPSYQFDIGDASNYTPVIVLFVGTTTGSGSLTASTVAAMPPVGSGLSQTQYINRKWTITNSGVAGFTSCSPTFTFVAGDEIGSPNTSNLVIRKWNGSTWALTTNGTRSSLSTQCTGITTFGDFYDGIDNCSTIAMWFGGTSTDWNTGSNWCSGVVPTSVTNVEIPSDPANQPNIGTAGGSCNNITIDAGASLTMGGAYSLNIYGNLSNNGAFTASTSTVIFRGTSAQSIGGNTITSFSNLTISNTSNTVSLGQNENMSGTLTVNAGATLALSTYTLGATTAPTGVTLYCGATTGSAITGTGTLTLGGNVTVTNAATGTSGAIISAPLALGATRTFSVADNGTPAIDLTVSGIISGSTFGVLKTGAGTLVLNQANSFSGTLTVNVGMVVGTSNAGALGAGAVSLSGGSLYLTNASGTGLNFGNNITVTNNSQITTDVTSTGAGNTYTLGTLSIGNQTLTITGGSNVNGGTAGVTFGSVTHTAAPTYTVSNPSVGGVTQLSLGAVSNSTYLTTFGGNGNVVQTGVFGNGSGGITYGGTGTLTLNQANTYTGATTLNSGTLNINNATALGSGMFTIGGTSTINNTSGGTITLSNNNQLALNSDFTFTGSNALNLGTGLTTMNGNRNITTSASTLTIGGTISQGAYNLTKTGSGTLSFGSNAVTLNGLTISTGTLASTSGTLTLNGNFSNSGSFSSNSGTVTFNGSSAQTTGGSSATTFNNLIINNSAGLTLGASATVGGILTLTSGQVTSTSTNLLAVTNTSSGAVTGYYSTGYVNGPLQWSLASGSSYFFPVGDASNYRPFEMNNITCSSPVVRVTMASTGASTVDTTLLSVAARNWYAQLISGSFTNATIRITESGLISTNVIASSPAQAGNYSSIGGNNIGSTITSNAGISYTASTYFAIGIPSPRIVLSDNSPQITAANVAGGTSNWVLHKSALTVTLVNATLTGMTCTTAGTYFSTDITNLKVYYSTSSTFSVGGSTLLSTLTTPGTAGIKTFPSFVSQTITGGTTGYIYITADIAPGATVGNNINLNALTVNNFTFTNGTRSGSTTVGGVQTIAYAIFYNKLSGAGALQTLGNWGINTDGTGAVPGSFTTNNQIFNIYNGASTTIGTAWTVSGTNSKVILGNSSVAAITFTVPSAYAFTGTIDIAAASSGSNTLTLQNSTLPSFGTLNAGSTVVYGYQGASQSVTAATYGNLTISGLAGTTVFSLAGTSTVSGNLSVTSGTFDIGANTVNRSSAGGTLTVANGATLRIGGTGTLPSNYSTHSIGVTSTVEYAGTTTTVAGLNSSQNYGNLVISGTGVVTPNSFAVATLLNVNSGGSLIASAGTITMNTGSTINNSGTLTFQGLTIASLATVYTSSSFSVNSALTFKQSSVFAPTSGIITMNNGSSISNSGTVTFYGLSIAPSATVTTSTSFSVASALSVGTGATFAPSAGTITMFNGSSISNSGTLTFQTLSIAASATVNTSSSFSINGNLITLGGSSFSPSVGSTITMNNGSFINKSGSLIFQGLTVAPSASVSGGVGSFAVNGTFTVSSGGIYTPDPAEIISGTGTLTGSGLVMVTRIASVASFNNQYSISNKNLTNLTVEYAGTSAEIISPGVYGYLNMNNSSGATLVGNATITGTLFLNSGCITSSSSNLLTLGGNCSIGGTPSNSSFVIGPLQKVGNYSFSYPIGADSGSVPVYAPLQLSGALLVTDTFTVEYHPGKPPYPWWSTTGNLYTSNLDYASGTEWWMITRGVTSTSTPKVTLFWNPNNINHFITNNEDLRVAHYNKTTSKWENMGGTGTGSVGMGYSAQGSIGSVITFPNYSPVTFGSQAGANPLPIGLINFELTCGNNNIIVSWSTASETNNAYFTIEKSTDFINWNITGKLNGAGNSDVLLNYNFADNNLSNETTYYRIKQTDFNGNFKYSESKAIICKNSTHSKISIAPNPVSDFININFSDIEGSVNIEICNIIGNTVKKFDSINIANNTLTINLKDLPSGIYFIKFNSFDLAEIFKIIKK